MVMILLALLLLSFVVVVVVVVAAALHRHVHTTTSHLASTLIWLLTSTMTWLIEIYCHVPTKKGNSSMSRQSTFQNHIMTNNFKSRHRRRSLPWMICHLTWPMRQLRLRMTS